MEALVPHALPPGRSTGVTAQTASQIPAPRPQITLFIWLNLPGWRMGIPTKHPNKISGKIWEVCRYFVGISPKIGMGYDSRTQLRSRLQGFRGPALRFRSAFWARQIATHHSKTQRLKKNVKQILETGFKHQQWVSKLITGGLDQEQ